MAEQEGGYKINRRKSVRRGLFCIPKNHIVVDSKTVLVPIFQLFAGVLLVLGTTNAGRDKKYIISAQLGADKSSLL